MIGGYADGGAGEDGRPKWRSVSLQGCPREVRLLLAGPYYFDVDMVNSLPNVARQLGRRGMVREASLRALSKLCSERDSVLKDIVEYYGLVDAAAQGVTARDRAKDLPIRILHGGGHAAWLAAQGLQESRPVLPLVAQLEAELRECRREVYAYVQRHDAAWLRGVEDHVRKAEARRPGARAVAGPQAVAAAAEREAWLRGKVEASVFARWLQDVEDGCLGCVRRVLQAEGWPARSWQQDGLLVEDEGGRRLRGGGGGDEAKARLEAAMRKAEAEVRRTQDMEVSLLVKSFFEAPVEAVLQRMAGAGGRRPSVAEAREVARRARAAGERAPPPPRTATSRAEAARAAATAAAAERRSRTLEAEWREARRTRCDAEARRRARLEGARGGGGDDGGGGVQGSGGGGVRQAGDEAACSGDDDSGDDDGSVDGDGAPTPPPAGGGAAPRDAAAGEAAGAGAGEAGERADVSGASGEAIGDDDDGDASQVRGAGRGVGGAARDDGEVGVSDDDVGGDDGDAGGRGGGGGDARRSGVAAVRDADVGGDGCDDNESVSRGGTPAPLSDGSGATPGGGAAGSEASEASERAGTSGTSGEATGDDDDDGDGVGSSGKKQGKTKGGRKARLGRNVYLKNRQQS